MYQAIKAANSDKRVGECRPGRGADEIRVGARAADIQPALGVPDNQQRNQDTAPSGGFCGLETYEFSA